MVAFSLGIPWIAASPLSFLTVVMWYSPCVSFYFWLLSLGILPVCLSVHVASSPFLYGHRLQWFRGPLYLTWFSLQRICFHIHTPVFNPWGISSARQQELCVICALVDPQGFKCTMSLLNEWIIVTTIPVSWRKTMSCLQPQLLAHEFRSYLCHACAGWQVPSTSGPIIAPVCLNGLSH